MPYAVVGIHHIFGLFRTSVYAIKVEQMKYWWNPLHTFKWKDIYAGWWCCVFHSRCGLGWFRGTPWNLLSWLERLQVFVLPEVQVNSSGEMLRANPCKVGDILVTEVRTTTQLSPFPTLWEVVSRLGKPDKGHTIFKAIWTIRGLAQTVATHFNHLGKITRKFISTVRKCWDTQFC